MGAYTAITNGDINDGATFGTGSRYPGDGVDAGDTVNTGSYEVTVPADATVDLGTGSSVSGSGKLSLEEGVTFTLSGDITCELSTVGTQTKPNTVESTGTAAITGKKRFYWTTFKSLGDAASAALSGSGDFICHNCTFDGCGSDQSDAPGPTEPYDITDSNWINSVGADWSYINSSAPDSTEARQITGCAFDHLLLSWDVDSLQHVTWSNNYQTNFLISGNGSFKRFSDVAVTNEHYPVTADEIDGWLQWMKGDNPHGLQFRDEAAVQTIKRGVWVAVDGWTTDPGDFILGPPGASNTAVYTLEHCVVCKNPNDGSSGTLLTLHGGADTATYRVENCTYYNGCVRIAENYAGRVGMIVSFRNNLALSDGNPGQLNYIITQGATPVAGYLVSADYNGYFNISAATRYNVDAGVISGTVGANDVTGDPECIDDTRSVLEYGKQVLNFTGTPGQLSDQMVEAFTEGRYDPTKAYFGLAIGTVIDWVIEGFSPQNLDYENGDGTYIGAAAPSTPVSDDDYLFGLVVPTEPRLGPGNNITGFGKIPRPR